MELILIIRFLGIFRKFLWPSSFIDNSSIAKQEVERRESLELFRFFVFRRIAQDADFSLDVGPISWVTWNTRFYSAVIAQVLQENVQRGSRQGLLSTTQLKGS